MVMYFKKTFIYFLLLTNLYVGVLFISQTREHHTEQHIVKSNGTSNFIFLAEIEENESETNNLENYHLFYLVYFNAKNRYDKQTTNNATLSNGKTLFLNSHSFQSKICVFRI